MSAIQNHKQALEEKIDELESKLAGLKSELKKEIESEQHNAIDQLDFHYTDLDSTFTSLKEFLDVLRDDFRKTFS
jgi:F0F1-type ATP synthase membrane subunit b/b'